MDAGTLLWILLIGGGVFAMFFMHRGGHAHGGLGGSGGHSHGHGGAPSDEQEQRREVGTTPVQSKDDPHGHEDEPASATGGHKHRGC